MTKIGKKLAAVFLAVAIVITLVPVLWTQTAYAESGSKVYQYRYDISKAYLDSSYTKLGIVLFKGDTLKDVSENREDTTDGCVYKGIYPGFDTDSVDTSVCTAEERTVKFDSDEGEKSATGYASLTVTSDKPVAVDGGDIVTDGPYIIMKDGLQVGHTIVNYKKISTHVLSAYTVNYDLDGGSWADGNPNEDSFQPGKDDYEYELSTVQPVKDGYTFAGWKPDSRTSAISLEAGYTLVIKGLFSNDEETMQGRLTQANALYNNGGYTLTADWVKDDEIITTVDIGNIWTMLDPVNVVPFTAEVHDETDADGVNFNDKMEIAKEQWSASDAPAISSSSSGIPVVGETYSYAITLYAKDGYAFNAETEGSLPFSLIVGGTEVNLMEHMVSAVIKENGKTATITFGSAPVAPVTIKAVDLSNSTVTDISNKTYTGKALTQSPTVKMNVNGTDVTLKSGTDYTLSYKNNTNVGTASVIITGKENYTGSITKTFTITKAANPLTIKAKTATVKYSKLTKKAQTLDVSKLITFTKKGQGTLTYTKASGNKKITINNKTGKVTVKKGLKKGTYKVKVEVKAAGNANYKASAVMTVTFKVKVK